MAKSDDWRKCLRFLLKDEGVIWEALGMRLAGLGVALPTEDEACLYLRPFGLAAYDMERDEITRRMLVVPARSDGVDKLFSGTDWADGRYWGALRGAPGSIVIRDRAGIKHVIGNVTHQVMFVDLDAWAAWRDSRRPQTALPSETAKMLKRYTERPK